MIKTTYETIDIERAKKFVSMDESVLQGFLETKEEFKKQSDSKNCLDIKRFCNKHIKKSGEPIKVNYNFSDDMVDNGRLYVKKDFTVQRLNSKVRGYLCNKYYYDIDMVNAQPSCLLYILKTYYSEHNWTFIDAYTKNRENVLSKLNDDRSVAKVMILTAMNSEKRVDSKNRFFIKLDNEFKKAQDLIWETDCEFTEDLKKYKGSVKYNKKSSYLNKVLCVFENMVLQNAISKFDINHVSSLIMDGFHISKDVEMSCDEVVNICNESSEEYGIKWAHKPFSTALDFLDDLDSDDEELNDYASVKEDFEKNHFVIDNPLIFGYEYEYEGKPTYGMYNKADFKTLCAPYKYMDIDNKGRQVTKDFVSDWIDDKTKRSYKQLDFSPVERANPEFYNTFQGFECDVPYQYKQDDEAVKRFIDHLSHLTAHDEPSVKYFTTYLADMIQNPDKPPGISILIKSPQGHGKDLLVDIMGKLINDKYICRTEDIKDVLGNFNTPIKDKVMCVLNELEGKDGWEYRDKLKGLITTTTLNINEKGIKHYKQKNSLRIFVFSNRMNPIEISADDRRFVVFKSHYKKPTPDYFNKLVDILDNKDALYSIFNYLKNYKIDIDIRRQRPVTKAYNDLRQNNINPVYTFLNEMFVNDMIDSYFDKDEKEYKVHKKTGNILIQSKQFFESYKDYLVENELTHITPNFKNIKQLLTEIDINWKKFKIDGTMKECYSFNKDEVQSKLEPMNIDDDVEELDEDDYE